jgi:hypothetical protein
MTTISSDGTKRNPTDYLNVIPLSQPVGASPVARAADKKFGPGTRQERDPFVTPRHENSTRLSPTASAFNPFMNMTSHTEASKSHLVASALSTELGLSRCLLVSSDSPLAAEEVNIWLNVRIIPLGSKALEYMLTWLNLRTSKFMAGGSMGIEMLNLSMETFMSSFVT